MRYLPLVALLFAAACSKSPEEEQVDLLNEMSDTLATVKDKSSAEAAKPKLEKLKKRMEELDKQGAMNQEDMPEELRKDAAAALQRFVQEMMRVMSNPETAEALRDLDFE